MNTNPGPPPQWGLDVTQIWNELERLWNAINSGRVEYLEYAIHYKEPPKPKEGRMYYADGVRWNPGSGKGLYIYIDGWQAITTSIGSHKPAPGILTLIGIAPYIHFDEILEQIPSSTLTLTGYAPNAHLKSVMIPNGSLTLTSFAPTYLITEYVREAVVSGSITLTGFAPTQSVTP